MAEPTDEGKGLFTQDARTMDDVLYFKHGLPFPISLEAYQSRCEEKRVVHTDEQLEAAFKQLVGLSPYGVVNLSKKT